MMNPTKSFMGCQVEILQIMVTHKGIYLDPDKIKVIQSMSPLKNINELRGL